MGTRGCPLEFHTPKKGASWGSQGGEGALLRVLGAGCESALCFEIYDI